jgi:hypothetical protein
MYDVHIASRPCTVCSTATPQPSSCSNQQVGTCRACRVTHLPEQHPEQARQQGPAQVQALVGVVVTVVLRAAAQSHQAQPVDHVAHEVGLRGQARRGGLVHARCTLASCVQCSAAQMHMLASVAMLTCSFIRAS